MCRTVVLLGAAAVFATGAAAAERALVLRRVTVFDPTSGNMLRDRTVVIQGERITAVGSPESPIRAPRGARIAVDGRRGREAFVLPGLIDAHVHLIHQPDFAHMTPEELLPMYLAWGVIGLRDIGDEIVAEKMTQRYASAHPDICPRVFLASPLLDGDPPHHADIGRAVTDPDKVVEVVEDLKAWGVATLKIYVKTDRPVGRRIIEEGHRQGMVVAAHLGRYKAQDAVSDGLDVLEHIWSVINYSFPATGEKPTRATIDLHNPEAVLYAS